MTPNVLRSVLWYYHTQEEKIMITS